MHSKQFDLIFKRRGYYKSATSKIRDTSIIAIIAVTQRIILRPSNLTGLRVRIALELGRRTAPRVGMQNFLGLRGLRGGPLEAFEGLLVFRRETRRRGARCEGSCEAGKTEAETGQHSCGLCGGKVVGLGVRAGNLYGGLADARNTPVRYPIRQVTTY